MLPHLPVVSKLQNKTINFIRFSAFFASNARVTTDGTAQHLNAQTPQSKMDRTSAARGATETIFRAIHWRTLRNLDLPMEQTRTRNDWKTSWRLWVPFALEVGEIQNGHLLRLLGLFLFFILFLLLVIITALSACTGAPHVWFNLQKMTGARLEPQL